MENLNIIKKQINSILAISKITNAMKVVAVSKTNKMKKMFLESSEYLNDMYKIIPSVMNNLDKLLIHTTKKTQPKTL
jgi:F0F1-type ATP synthase gamma subunit